MMGHDDKSHCQHSQLTWDLTFSKGFCVKCGARIVVRALVDEAQPSHVATPEETKDSVGDWQCRDYGDSWITFPTRKAAEKYQKDTGAMMRYRRFYPAAQPECAGPFVDAKDCPIHRKDTLPASTAPLDAEGLGPCPMCRLSENVKVHPDDKSFVVKCGGCGLTTGEYHHLDFAAAMWNSLLSARSSIAPSVPRYSFAVVQMASDLDHAFHTVGDMKIGMRVSENGAWIRADELLAVSATVPPIYADALDTLVELVRLKRIKERMEEAGTPGGPNNAELTDLEQDYKAAKPDAWGYAKAVVGATARRADGRADAKGDV